MAERVCRGLLGLSRAAGPVCARMHVCVCVRVSVCIRVRLCVSGGGGSRGHEPPTVFCEQVQTGEANGADSSPRLRPRAGSGWCASRQRDAADPAPAPGREGESPRSRPPLPGLRRAALLRALRPERGCGLRLCADPPALRCPPLPSPGHSRKGFTPPEGWVPPSLRVSNLAGGRAAAVCLLCPSVSQPPESRTTER